MRYSMSTVSDIKLIRTDTTLDLSQKAEKRWRKTISENLLDQKWRLSHVVVVFVVPPKHHERRYPRYLLAQRHMDVLVPVLLLDHGWPFLCCFLYSSSNNKATEKHKKSKGKKKQVARDVSLHSINFRQILSSTTIPPGKHRFSSDHRS